MVIIRLLLLLCLVIPRAFAEENPRFYLGRNYLNIDWANINENDYLDYYKFEQEMEKRRLNPNYDREKRDLLNRERVGFVISCILQCEIERARGKNNVRYLSSVREGDELTTFKESYLWLYLLDGTMVRLSPETSITLNEINVGRNKNFTFARLNYGNILWLSRSKSLIKKQKTRETDRLFSPLALLKANKKESESVEDMYDRLNKLITANNQNISKKSETFLVLPNGSFFGRELSGEFFSILNGKSYFKLRDYKQLGIIDKKEDTTRAKFYFRGHTNDRTKDLDIGPWYEVNELGTAIKKSYPSRYALGELITKNIPSILIAREYMFQRYSEKIFAPLSKKVMGEKVGYRLWSEDEFKKRFSFIVNYTRRLETTQLNVLKDFWSRKKGLEPQPIDTRYYTRAMNVYALETPIPRQSKEKPLLLNSEKKAFWKVINERR